MIFKALSINPFEFFSIKFSIENCRKKLAVKNLIAEALRQQRGILYCFVVFSFLFEKVTRSFLYISVSSNKTCYLTNIKEK